MGQDKSRLKLGGSTFLEEVEKIARQLTPQVRIIREDIVPRCGPLGGVYTGLKTSQAQAVLFLSCDMPLVTPALLQKLLQIYARVPHPVFTVEKNGPGFPFLLPKETLETVQQQIARNELALRDLCAALSAAQLEPAPHELPPLRNINTPREYQALTGIRIEPSAPAVLEIENLSIRRGKVQIVADLNWRIQRGEHWIILGANGSGKTSLLSALLGYMTPTDGTIRVMGEEFGDSDWRALRTKIGLVSSSIRQMMPEHEPALITVASGRFAMIDFWGTPTKPDQAKARKILRQVECEYAADRPWMYLSQGERQRVLIGRALMAKPKLLILDEPCAGLDPAAREHFLQFLERLGRQKYAPALVLVTHHVEEIMPVFTHGLLLKEGRELVQGELAKVLTSSDLSQTFSARMLLRKANGRYTLSVKG